MEEPQVKEKTEEKLADAKATVQKMKESLIKKMMEKGGLKGEKKMGKPEVDDDDEDEDEERPLNLKKIKMSEGVRILKKGLKSDDDEAILDGLQQILAELQGG